MKYIKVTGNNEGIYTVAAYEALRLSMSTGDFHMHKHQEIERKTAPKDLIDLEVMPQNIRDVFPQYKFSHEKLAVLEAYCDCLDQNVTAVRNLNFFSTKSFSFKEAYELMKHAVPNGYNEFDVDKAFSLIRDYFGVDCSIRIAREGSVCLYIKPSQNVWTNRYEKFQTIADEVYFDHELSMFRLWWD